MTVNSPVLKNSIVVIVIICGLVPLAYFARVQYGVAQDDSLAMEVESLYPSHEQIDRRIDNIAFGVGEWLQFDIGYGFINAGSATLEVREIVEYNGRPAYQLVSTAKSNKFFSSFYPVRDRVESILDAVGLFSWRFEKELREGKYRSHRKYAFDQINHSVVYKGDTIEVAPYVQDALSVLYYMRTQKLEPGKSILVDNFTDGKNYPLEVIVHGRERVETKAGVFDCLVVEPLLRSSGIFKHEGKLTVYLTDDRLRLPVMMKSKVVVGSITAELTDYRLGRLIEF
jgi:hypothetical protein